VCLDVAERRQWKDAVRDGHADSFDPPLTRGGEQQAAESARQLRALLPGRPFDVVYCSPLLRCVQTAAPVATAFDVPITIVPGLGECCAALQSSNPRASKRWPKLVRTLERLTELCPVATFTPPDPCFPEAFSSADGTCPGRLARGRHRVLLVSHRESIRGLVALQPDYRRRASDMHTPYACVGLFRCHGAGSPSERWEYAGLLPGMSAHR
jgi:broad specificity phosphatase PhoE